MEPLKSVGVAHKKWAGILKSLRRRAFDLGTVLMAGKEAADGVDKALRANPLDIFA